MFDAKNWILYLLLAVIAGGVTVGGVDQLLQRRAACCDCGERLPRIERDLRASRAYLRRIVEHGGHVGQVGAMPEDVDEEDQPQ